MAMVAVAVVVTEWAVLFCLLPHVTSALLSFFLLNFLIAVVIKGKTWMGNQKDTYWYQLY